ncbi:MAG: erythromycin esterase family protein [Lachnospiraceae bacterium]|nr:erythromycin esterase family protein [Lachnospiraceae bacterium]MDD3794858.1 erythromycin esterase family protein [Lachnospiraceae bacterium]
MLYHYASVLSNFCSFITIKFLLANSRLKSQECASYFFKALAENNGCRTFIIEGDFGGALKVDQYINGGNGTAEEVVAEIGFAIYRTHEMADLTNWTLLKPTLQTV